MPIRPLVPPLVIVLAFSGSCLAAGGVVDLGILPGGTSSHGFSLSADGAVVTGWADTSSGDRAFIWTADAGMQSLGTLPGGGFSRGAAITSDGLIVIGTSGTSSGDRAFRWTSSGGMVSLGTLIGGASSAANGICPDGGFTVGSSSTTIPASSSRAAMWAGGWVDIGAIPGETVSVGASINQFASAVAGWSGVSPRRAMRWASGPGAQSLGMLPNATDSFANGISLDGAVAAGGSTISGVVHAFRWSQAAGLEDLGALVSGGSAEAFATDSTGGAIVGTATNASGQPRAFVWTRAHGMVDLNAYLASPDGGSLNLSGWTLTDVRAISFDSTAIVGTGVHDGATRAFVIRNLAPLNPPCRAEFDGQPGLSPNDIFSFLNAWFNLDPRADVNHSGSLNAQDIFDFLAYWFAGC